MADQNLVSVRWEKGVCSINGGGNSDDSHWLIWSLEQRRSVDVVIRDGCSHTLLERREWSTLQRHAITPSVKGKAASKSVGLLGLYPARPDFSDKIL